MHTNNRYSTLSDDLQKQSHVRNQAANPFRDSLGQEQDKGRSGTGTGSEGSGEGVFIPATVSSKYEEAPVPGDTRFASGRNDTEALVPRSEDIDQQPSSIEIETRQRPNKLQNEPLIGVDKLGVPKSKQE